MTILDDIISDSLGKLNKIAHAIVIAINDNATVSVKLPVKIKQVNRETGETRIINRPHRHNVIYPCLSFGNYTIYLPLKVGDRGILFSFDKDSNKFFDANGKDSEPGSLVTHSFDSAFFLPLNFFPKKNKINNNKDFIIDKKGKEIIKIEDNSDEITLTGKINIEGDVYIKGILNATEDVKVGSLGFKRHIHGYIDTKGTTPTPSNTEPPK